MFVVFLCVFESVAFEVHIDDDGVIHESVDNRGGGHLNVGESFFGYYYSSLGTQSIPIKHGLTIFARLHSPRSLRRRSFYKGRGVSVSRVGRYVGSGMMSFGWGHRVRQAC